ncbi:MAG: hypothetical protein KJ072_13995 [Verrucomicrobia bacterium]|nr:hypothetical protein [Verrucomicrobiota bacterium]
MRAQLPRSTPWRGEPAITGAWLTDTDSPTGQVAMSAGALRFARKARATCMLGLLAVSMAVAQESAPRSEPVHFRAVEVFVDSKDKALAAYQLEFSASGGDAKIVGIEGGGHAEFREAPFYDPKAIQQERVIFGAFSTASADRLPKGITRVATIHLRTVGIESPRLTVKVSAAATAGGDKIPITASAKEKPHDEN